MKKIWEFFKSIFIVTKWTIWYFFVLWLILKYIFEFDMFSYNYWWKFFHTTTHGFVGFVFTALIYSAIPLYIVTTITTWRNKEYAIKIPLFPAKKKPAKSEEKSESAPEPEQSPQPQFPADLPPELRVPFMRARQHLSVNGATSVYNQPQIKSVPKETKEPDLPKNEIPIPTDFEIDDDIMKMEDSVPTFKDIDFDIPIATEKELKNNTTKYFDKNNTEYETFHDFVATDKYVIYEHSDPDFWVMDNETWFASGKTKDSPISELKELAQQNELTPVIYLASQNIMDIDNVIKSFESAGIRVIKSLDELG